MKGIDKIKIILAVMGVLICGLLFLAGFLIGDAHGRKAAAASVVHEKELRGTVVNKDNVNDVSTEPDKVRNAPATYEVIMNTEWKFDNTGRESFNAYVENSRDNNTTVRFVLSFEDQPDKILYSSDKIPVGGSLRGIRLEDELPKGRSKAVVTYQLLDDEGSTVGEVKAGVTLVYEE